ncbi:DUF983 domain-containing protein [Niastella yeongjuensis]|uniref:DUF983 domain-containing protein n=1 Tax=Niastella yeongjuensis TaxID=354355 RepID=A0A1V9E9N5_9BACT|nr:DUF983 domain-containing protein [Niastella yeongjuensis]OQP42830.1 DUF983 domain-containing protein [Niastella yeongjuensis]SEO55888.1 hypothetical protein SAMN05660816_03021 [Niastella yeongjuensis]
MEASINIETADKKPSVFTVFKCKCPRCRRGDMFENKNPYALKTTMKMNKECPVCGQPFNIEVGFYYGSSYVSYAASIALSVATFVAWWVLIGFSLQDNRFFYWLTFNSVFLIVAQPYLMRLARTGWLMFFVRYDINWRTPPTQRLERINEEQEKNW